MVMEVVQEDIAEDSMQCAIHPFKNNTPGAICAFCLQEKLGNLVSSAFSVAIFLASPSPPPSPSSKPTINGTSATTTTTTAAAAATTLTSSAITLHRSASTHSNQIVTRRGTLPFLLVQRMNKKKTKDGDIAIRRCNSTTTPRHDQRAKRRGFWSFLYPTSASSTSSKHTIAKKPDKTCKHPGFMTTSHSTTATNGATGSSKEWKTEDKTNVVVNKHGISPDKAASGGRKVSRSRSVGCGSKSFSGDFFGRLSTGLGDCTLRRVESQREGKAKNKMHTNGGHNNDEDCIKGRVKCGRIFSSFMINHSSSSSSSFEDQNLNRRTTSNVGHHNNQSRAFATPIRFFSTKYSNGVGSAQSKNATPNLTSIPSLLAAGS